VVSQDSDGRLEIRDDEGGRLLGRVAFVDATMAEGLELLNEEAVDLVLGPRGPSAVEISAAQSAGTANLRDPLRARAVALDAVVALRGPLGEVEHLSVAQIRDSFAGEIDNWSALGGRDAPIVLHLHEEDADRSSPFMRQIMNGAGIASQVTLHSNFTDLNEAVDKDPYALGISRLALSSGLNLMDLTSTCGFVTRADGRAIKPQDYPFSAPVFLYSPAYRQPALTREFIRFVSSSAAQPSVLASPYVDQSIETIDVAANGRMISSR